MRLCIGLLLMLYLPLQAPVHAFAGHAAAGAAVVPPVVVDEDEYRPEALRRGGFRSPRMGYTGGNRTSRNPAVNQPARTPASPAAPARRAGGFLGGMFGGLLAGSLLGSLFNPFGFGGAPGGFSLIGLLFWVVVLYLVYRLFRSFRRRER